MTRRSAHGLCGILLALLVGVLPGVAGSGGTEPALSPPAPWVVSLHGDDLTVQADRAPLRLVLVEIAKQGGFRLVLSEAVTRGVVSARFAHQSLLEGLDRLLVGWPYAVIQPPISKRSRRDAAPQIVELLVLSPAASDSGLALTVSAPDPAAGLANPDPQTRIMALEQWAAQREGPGVDPLTYALVDEDETVRARAQELFEEALTRE